MGSTMTTAERVINLIKEQLGQGDITPETRFREDLECDSLDAIEIVMELEGEFDILTSDAEADPEKFQTVADVIAAMEAKVGTNPDAAEEEAA